MTVATEEKIVIKKKRKGAEIIFTEERQKRLLTSSECQYTCIMYIFLISHPPTFPVSKHKSL